MSLNNKEYLKEEFTKWISGQKKPNGDKYSSNTIYTYINSLRICCKSLKDFIIEDTDLFYQNKVSEFSVLKENIIKNPNFDAINKKSGNGAFNAAMNLYEIFLKERNTGMPNISEFYWFVGADYGVDGGNQIDRFLKEGIWENGFTDKLLDEVKSMKVGEMIAIKSAYTRKNNLPFDNKGQYVSVMGIKAIGTITKNRGDGRVVEVDWQPFDKVREWYFFTGRTTVCQITEKPDDWMYKALIDFTFYGEKQEINRFLEHPFWKEKYSDVDNEVVDNSENSSGYYSEIIAALKLLGGKGLWREICDKIEVKNTLPNIHTTDSWRNIVNAYLQFKCSDSGKFQGKEDLFTWDKETKIWGLRGFVTETPYTKEQFLNEAYISEEKYNTIVSRLEKKNNIILQGAPGVGKSFLAKKLAYSILGFQDNEKVQMIQFHQSYSYEDFIMGFRPNKNGGFDMIEGVFQIFCKKALEDPNGKYFFIIDEINRGNLSKIFGELMLLIEADKRGKEYEMSTVYSDEKFCIPKNLYIVGLMNTADRSLALLDYALRRRFSFVDIEPAFGENFTKYTNKFIDTKLDKLLKVIIDLNNEIEKDESLGFGFKIGHSYFCNLERADTNELSEIIDCEIIPLLEEYWFEVNDKVKNWSAKLKEALIDG